MNRRIVVLEVCVVALTLGGTAAWAGNGNGNVTSAGETSANEGVCDILRDATPGLYGLCVAFCEAQDCEPDFTLADPYENCKPGSLKVLDNYNRRKKPGDPEMPCIQQDTCPCWTTEELIVGVQQGRYFDQTICENQCGYWSNTSGNSENQHIAVMSFQNPDSYFDFRVNYRTFDYSACQYSQYCGDSSCEYVLRYIPISGTEAKACVNQLLDFGAENSLPCF